MSVGALVVELSASVGKFQSDMGKATAHARTASNQIKASFSSVNSILAGLGVGISVAGITAFIKSSIDAADKLKDLSALTGVAATTLGGIGFAAQQAGGDLEGAAAAFRAFNKNISEALGGNAEAIENFRKLGISIGDLRTLTPDQVMIKTADAFSRFAEGAEKAAGMAAFFGKGFGSVAGLLNEGGESLRKNIEYYKQYSGITEELVRKSDEFNDSMTKLRLLTNSFGAELASALLPYMQALANHLLAAKENSTAFKDASVGVVDALRGIARAAANAWFYVQNFGDALAYNALQSKNIAKLMMGQGGLEDAINLWKERQRNVADLTKQLQAFEKVLEGAEGKSQASGFGGVGTDRGIANPLKQSPNFTKAIKGVDEFQKMLERAKEMAAEADAELRALLSLDKITAAEKALAKLQETLDFKKLAPGEQQKIKALYDYASARQKEQELVKSGIKDWEDQAKALADADDSWKKLQATMREGIATYALQNNTMERELELVGKDVAAHERLAETIKFEAMQAEAKKVGITLDRSLLEERIRLIDELAKRIKQFNETEQIASIFRDSFADSVTDVVMGTKSISEAFKDMERNIVGAITRIASQNLANALFGGVGSSGPSGMFSWLAGLLGGFGGSSGATIPMQPGGGYAGGTNFAPGGLALVGERGPEIVSLPRGSKVTPNHKLGGNVVNINVNVPTGTTGASADRIAVMTGQAVSRAMRRNA